MNKDLVYAADDLDRTSAQLWEAAGLLLWRLDRDRLAAGDQAELRLTPREAEQLIALLNSAGNAASDCCGALLRRSFEAEGAA